MPSTTVQLTVTLADTDWHRYSAADCASLGSIVPMVAGQRILSVWPESVTVQNASICYGERVGNLDGGTRGTIYIPDISAPAVARALHGSTLTLKNQTVTFVNTGDGSSGTTIDVSGKTRAAVVAEVVALLTIAATAIADLEVAAGSEPGVIVLQSDASAVDAATWTAGAHAYGQVRLYADGLAAGAASLLDASASSWASKEMRPDDECRAISLRARTAGAVIVLQMEVDTAVSDREGY